MKEFVNKVEKSLIRFVVLSLLLMVLAQGLMTVDPIRFYLSWGERLEGQNIGFPASNQQENSPVESGEVKSPKSRLAISVDKFSALPRAKILINGKEKYSFIDKQVKVEISAGDTIEIDSSAYNFPVQYKIEAVSANLAYPKQGQTFIANQTIVMVGKIIVK